MLVVVILAVASMAVVPNFVRSIQAAELRSTAENLIASVRIGQIRALTQGRWYRIVLNPTQYWLEQELQRTSQESLSFDKPSFERATGKYGRQSSLPSGIILKDYPSEVLLSPGGKISSSELKVCRDTRCIGIAAGRELGQIELISVKDNQNAAI